MEAEPNYPININNINLLGAEYAKPTKMKFFTFTFSTFFLLLMPF
jgi:hypothetical protein